MLSLIYYFRNIVNNSVNIIFDHFLLHFFLAGNPNKSCEYTAAETYRNEAYDNIYLFFT